MSWAALSAPSAPVAALAADLPARAHASSAAALQALAAGQDGAAEELAALADAPEVACEAPPPQLEEALAATPLPYYMLSQDVLTRRHNSMRGTMDICSAAQAQVDAAAAQRERLGAVRPAVAVRAAPPGSPEAQQLALQLQLWLYGTQRRPVPEALRQQRQQQRHDFQRGMEGGAAAARDPHTAALLRLIASDGAILIALSCRPALRALKASPEVADIYPACCLGPATSQCAIGLAWLLAAGGAHISRDERPGLAELFSVLGLLLRAGDLEALQPLLRDVKVCYAKSRDQALRDLSTPTPGDELIASSKEKAKHAKDGVAVCGVTNPAFAAVACIMLTPGTLMQLKLGERVNSRKLQLHFGAEIATWMAQIARALAGEDAEVYEQMAALFDSSRYLTQQVLLNSSPIKVIRYWFHCVKLPAHRKLSLLLAEPLAPPGSSAVDSPLRRLFMHLLPAAACRFPVAAIAFACPAAG